MRAELLALYEETLPYVAVELDLFADSWQPGEVLRQAELNLKIIAPIVVTALVGGLQGLTVVDDIGALLDRLRPGWPEPHSRLLFHASVACIKYCRGEPATVQLGAGDARNVEALLRAWSAPPRRLSKGRNTR